MSEDEDASEEDLFSDPKRADSWNSSALNLLQYVHLVNAETTWCRPNRISENFCVN